jgi:phosphopantothenoylcysteine synthetase/decarboxylase
MVDGVGMADERRELQTRRRLRRAQRSTLNAQRSTSKCERRVGLAALMKGRVLVTCGPSYEPIDEVRRITNFSTGELGGILANRLAADGYEVTCLRGSAAPGRFPFEPRVEHTPFTTNDDLREKLTSMPNRDEVIALFHAAALADFRVESTRLDRKISSRSGPVTLTLVPATKLIGKLRELFPSAWLVGWKYELDGSCEEVIAKARRQLMENATDVCVVNGAAYGSGFGVLSQQGELTHVPDKAQLCEFLTNQLQSVS